jgi:signal transduction histidine kinase
MNHLIQLSGSEGRVVTGRPRELETVRVLVVDDDPQAAALLEMALADARFARTIEVVSTAAAGLNRIQDDAHDVYVVDQRLPDGTGLELIRNAKARGVTKPFILMTGYGSGTLDEAALEEGAADYVEKHLLSTQLERSIRYALRDWQATGALLEREEQLRQSQKMEAIGRLAGGIAHDFNNLLTAIIGHTDIVFERLPASDASTREVREIRRAADRAASLTRQLLAFGRKQLLHPVLLDLNETVMSLLQMLPRVIGAHIKTTTKLSPGLHRIKADASQLEQVLLNLVLNARDAMPSGGTITIETTNEDDVADETTSSLKPGRYAVLAVGDTGTGMDAVTRARAFEPFFTTKPTGKGTGLGLATVYGIVEQSGGAIGVDTAVGRGTTIRIYLRAAPEGTEPEKPAEAQPPDVHGTETIMVVEDNEAVRVLARRALRQRGYTVIEARNAEQALDWIERGTHPDLLLTDVVMPGMSGPELAARLLEQYPRVRVLYMSGYSYDAAKAHGTFWEGAPLLQKPFTPKQLAEQVRRTLDT